MYCVQSLTPFAPDNSVSAGVVASLTFDRKWPIEAGWSSSFPLTEAGSIEGSAIVAWLGIP